jgi:methionine-rich copper-binding protein CopC
MLLVSVGVLVTSALTAPTACAHNVLVATDPAADAVLARVPATVTLTFDQPAIGIGSQVVISGPNGPVQDGDPRLVDRTVAEDITAGAPAGQYHVLWRVTSADGHPVSGQFTFTANAPGGGTQPVGPSTVASHGRSARAATATATQSGWAMWPALLVAGVLTALALLANVVIRHRRTQ